MFFNNFISTLLESGLSLYVVYFINSLFSLALNGYTNGIVHNLINFLLLYTSYKIIFLIIDILISIYTEKKKETFKMDTLMSYVNHSKSKLTTQEVIKRLGSDFDKVYECKVMLLSTLLSEVIIAVVACVIIAYVSIPLMVISIIGVSLYALLPIFRKANFEKIYAKVEKLEEVVENDIKETIDNFQSIKLFNLNEFRCAGYQVKIENSRVETIVAERKFHTFRAMLAGVRQTTLIVFMGVILYFISTGILDIENVILCVFLINILKDKIEIIAKSSVSIFESNVSQKRLNELSVSTEELKDIENKINSIQFCGIDFSYSEPIFKNLNINLKGNTIYQLEGPNGSGKTTFIKMILGEENRYSGKIFANDYELNTVNKVSYRDQISYLSQTNIMFSGDGKFNLNLVEHVDLDILKLLKFDLNLLNNESKSLSEGQRQKLCLARALSKEARILILDEPESFLDTDAITTLKAYLKECNKLVIIISHTTLLQDVIDRKLILKNFAIRGEHND